MYSVTLVWPGDLLDVGCVLGQFERCEDGRIWAIYNTREELAWALSPMIREEMGRLERRLEMGLEKIRECEDERMLQRLLAQWERLIERHQALIEDQAMVMVVLQQED